MGKYVNKKTATGKVEKVLFLGVFLSFALLVTVCCIAFIGRSETKGNPVDQGNVTASTNAYNQTDPTVFQEKETVPVAGQDQTDPPSSFAVLENENKVVIRTEYFELELPNTFAETILVDPVDYFDRYALEFKAKTLSETVPLYTVWIGHKTGTVLGVLHDNDTDKIVCIEFHNPPKSLTESELNTFYAAQETANDIIEMLNDLTEPYEIEDEPVYETEPENVGTSPTEGEKPDDPTTSTLESNRDFQIRENGHMIEVVTKFGTLAYPLAFEELVEVIPEETQDGYALRFYCTVDNIRMPVYSVWFNSEKGMAVGNILDAMNNESRVSIEYFEAPADLTGGGLDVFYAAQETVNDIIRSLQDSE